MLNNKFLFVLGLFLIFNTNAFAQKDKVLFTVNGEKIMNSEFSRVYEKNLSLISDPSQKDLDNYLELYINYKLKLQDAYAKKMDTIGSYLREYEKYENQLIQPYLKDENIELDLIKEAYDRLKKEVNASHILIKTEKGQDTLQAYNKLLDIRNRIEKGEDFDKLARESSQDPSANKNAGNLGYFTAFQMVYPFENIVYNTKVGEVSMPFKTQFGYHIVKLNDIRDSKGEVEVAHIMLKGDIEKNKPIIENIKKQLSEGTDFAELAKTQSQDGGTAKNGGLLPKFGSGRMIPSFENVAFSLKNEGDISDPFQTDFGWHIIKLIKKHPLESFENMKESLKQKVEQGQRAQLIGNSVVKRLIKEYDIIVNDAKLAEFSKPDWRANENLQKKDPLLTIEGQKYSVGDFYNYYEKQANNTTHQVFNTYQEEKIIDIYKARLPQQHPELKETMKEYRQGLLLFDMMQNRIWDRSEKDTLGLNTFFETQKDKYKWGKRAKLTVVNLKKQNMEVLKALQNQVDNDSIWSQYKDTCLVDIRNEVIELSDEKYPKELKADASEYLFAPSGSQFKLYYVKEILPESSKKLSEVKGKVMSDYQDQLEKDWIKELRTKYVVKVNKSTLKKLKAKYKN